KLICRELKKSDIHTLTLNDTSLIKRNIRNARLSVHPNIPKNIAETHAAINEITLVTNTNESFLLVNDNNCGIVGFSTKSNLEVLCGINTIFRGLRMKRFYVHFFQISFFYIHLFYFQLCIFWFKNDVDVIIIRPTTTYLVKLFFWLISMEARHRRNRSSKLIDLSKKSGSLGTVTSSTRRNVAKDSSYGMQPDSNSKVRQWLNVNHVDNDKLLRSNLGSNHPDTLSCSQSFFEVRHDEQIEISNSGMFSENVAIQNKGVQNNSNTICMTDFMNTI
ncbi:Uncharacterized protein FWK35_00033042, partial [Aphis craccivora]